MPNLDNSGPTGQGPTGFGRGECVTPRRGVRGRWFGFGLGRQTMKLEEEKRMLEKRLEEINKMTEEK